MGLGTDLNGELFIPDPRVQSKLLTGPADLNK